MPIRILNLFTTEPPSCKPLMPVVLPVIMVVIIPALQHGVVDYFGEVVTHAEYGRNAGEDCRGAGSCSPDVQLCVGRLYRNPPKKTTTNHYRYMRPKFGTHTILPILCRCLQKALDTLDSYILVLCCNVSESHSFCAGVHFCSYWWNADYCYREAPAACKLC